jgi:hypothetical protein
VALLALIAGTVSYLHMHLLVELHGQPGWVATLTPLSVDGMIVAASTTLLADARSGSRLVRSPPWLANPAERRSATSELGRPTGGVRSICSAGAGGIDTIERPSRGDRDGSDLTRGPVRRFRTGTTTGPPRDAALCC